MLTKIIVAAVAVLGVGSAGTVMFAKHTGQCPIQMMFGSGESCCSPDASCCTPPQECCLTSSCCSESSAACCESSAPCCESASKAKLIAGADSAAPAPAAPAGK